MALDYSQLGADNELARRYITDFPRVESYYAGDYRRADLLAQMAARLVNRTWRGRFDRELTANLLADYATRQEAPLAVLDNIELLREPQCVCIVTGQQAGLGGGPLLVLYKALTAIRLAREVADASGQPCIPVFWNASDDSDVEEVNRLRGQGPRFELLKHRFDIPAGKRHVRDIALPADGPAWESAVKALGTGPYVPEAAAMLRDAAGRDFGTAFTRLLYRLLGERGLIVIEPRALTSHPAWRRVHALEIENRDDHRQVLQRVADRLEAQGMPAGVPVTSHLNLFHTVDGERRHISAQGRTLVQEGQTAATSKTALLAALRANPGLFTPNVMLRPVVQNAIFPTVAYVGGQAEIAYHGLLKGLHREAGAFMPALFPRLSLSLVSREHEAGFEKLVAYRKGLKWRQGEAAIVHEEAQAGVRAAFRDLRENLSGLARPLEQELQKFEQRTLRSTADVMVRVKHDPLAISEGGAEMQPLIARYFPEDRPQERTISLLSAWASYGRGLLDVVDAIPNLFEFQHHVCVTK